MLYIQYNDYKNKYHNAQKEYDEIISEKEKLFAATQPQATVYDKEKVNGGSPSNVFDEYLIQKEKKNIEARLTEARSILNERKRLLTDKQEELLQSKNDYDILYRYKYIDNLRVRVICRKMPYCRASIYNMLNEIRKNIKFRQ